MATITTTHSTNYAAIVTASQISGAQKFHVYDRAGFLALLIVYDDTGKALYFYSANGLHDDAFVTGSKEAAGARLKIGR